MLKKLTRELKATAGIYEAREDQTYGVLAEFSNPGALMHAAEAMRETGYTHFDTHSPFPIHGMDRAMGLTNSKVGYFTFGGALTGLLIGFLLQWWTSAVDYPINVSGKPFFAFEPSIPIMFELTILFGAFGTVAGMLALNGLPRPYNPLFYSDRFARASDDGFFLHVATSDERFDARETEALLRKHGATYVETLKDHGTAGSGVEEEEGEARTPDASAPPHVIARRGDQDAARRRGETRPAETAERDGGEGSGGPVVRTYEHGEGDQR